MLQLNAIINLGADAETKTINDKKYISFRGASTEKKDGRNEVTWISVLAGYNENVLPYLKKGQQVFVSGRMSAKLFQNQNSFGIDISVFANTLQLCGAKREGEQQQNVQATPTPQPVQTPFPPEQPEDVDSQLPF